MTDRYDVMAARKRGDRTYWVKLGAAFRAKNGDGFNIVLDALPVPDERGEVRLSLLPPRERDGQPQPRQGHDGGYGGGNVVGYREPAARSTRQPAAGPPDDLDDLDQEIPF